MRPVSATDATHLTMSAQYDTHTWNTQVTTRGSDNAASHAFYNPFGLPDSTADPIGVRAVFRRDLSGRVYRSKVGTLAPTVWTFFNPDGLADSIKIGRPRGDAGGVGCEW